MFTGIITDVGRVLRVEKRGGIRFRIQTAYDVDGIEIGASIACSGVCLTVVDKGEPEGGGLGGGWFDVDVSGETLAHTNLGSWAEGAKVNLERALKVGDELGGHVVTGHVDAVGQVRDRRSEGDSLRLAIQVPEALSGFIAQKGSVTVNGVSLTVNEVEDAPSGKDDGGGATFGVNIIPHTQKMTTLGALAPGDEVNIEIDVLARYVARLKEVQG